MVRPVARVSRGPGSHPVQACSFALLPDTLACLTSCQTVTDLGLFMFEIVASIGLQATAGGMLTGPKALSGDLFYFNNWPNSWLEIYRVSGILELDPIVRWAMASGTPITWADLAKRLDPNDPGRELFLVAAQHGYKEGFALPVRSQAGHIGLLSVAGDRGALSGEEQTVLQVLGTAAMNRAETLAGDNAAARPVPSLTKRERECVALLVHGMGERAIASKLGISAVTARFHLDNARLKMRASSRAHLAELAAGFTQNIR